MGFHVKTKNSFADDRKQPIDATTTTKKK